MTGLAVVAMSLGSALSAATSSVLRHRSARLVPPPGPRYRLFHHLLTRPVWLAGLASRVSVWSFTPWRWFTEAWWWSSHFSFRACCSHCL